ncbi:hypothetical protein CGGC5_v000100 [Colletotrichum fructicola Nara gc5]|uniref:Uncharacterized protein n=1 Tax=Colletotrichum fructicola (strain Nara gc5) TaxID=1213859 RepID=A0A7J6JK10_COLFN|nr:hypothetical protein CGGC5_v000100 [Colletotrichum fructicola Nara gc5]
MATEWTNYLAVTRRKVQLLHHQTDHVGNTARNSASSFLSSGTRNKMHFGASQLSFATQGNFVPKKQTWLGKLSLIAVAPVVVAAPRLVSVVARHRESNRHPELMVRRDRNHDVTCILLECKSDVVLRLGSTVTSTDEDILVPQEA